MLSMDAGKTVTAKVLTLGTGWVGNRSYQPLFLLLALESKTWLAIGSVHACTISYKHVIVFVTHGNECTFVYMSPFKSTRIALSIGGMTAVLASICCLGPFLLVTLGFSSAWILYLLTLAEWSRPFFIVLALIALCFAYQRMWHPVSAYKSGQIFVTPQIKRTYKAYFLFVTMLMVTVLMLPYVVSDFN